MKNKWNEKKLKEGWKQFSSIRPIEIFKKLQELDKKLYTEYKLKELQKESDKLNKK